MATMFMGEESGDTDVKCLPILESIYSLMTMTMGCLANNYFNKNKILKFRPEINLTI